MSVPVTGLLTPYPSGRYAITDPLLGIDGWRSVPDHATRNQIPTYLRRAGMPVWTQNTSGNDGLSGAWQLKPSPWTGGDSDWSQLALGNITTLLSPKDSCRVATTGPLAATYANGSSGVGATLTNSGTQVALVIDGVTLTVGDRVLDKDQGTKARNGIYIVTNTGSGSTNWVLTRATDYDQASEISEGTYTIIAEGTVNFGTLWIQSNIGPFVIGTTPITWIQLQIAAVGTVTSVGMTVPTSILDIIGSPVTGSGVLAVSLATQAANLIWSGPVSGSAAPPTFRLSVLADLPAIPAHTILANTTGLTATPAAVTTNLKIDSSYGLINVVADGSTITFDWGVSNKHKTVLGGNRTLVFTNVNIGQTVLIQLGQGTGGHTVTWPGGIIWTDNAPPTLSTQASVFDEVVLTCESSGVYFGRLAARNIGGTPTPTPTPTPSGATYAVARFLAGPDSDIAVANDIADWVPLVGSGTLTGGFINSKAGDGPVGADLILDIKLSDDGGSTWTSLWAITPANLPMIADGDTIGSVGTPDTTSYSNGNLVRLDAIQVGSGTPGKNVFVALF